MSMNQTQIIYMICKLKQWNQSLGGASARKRLANSQFDSLQEQFLIKRHQVQQLQNQKQKLGLNTKTATHSFKIRQGISQMATAIGRMKQQHRKLAKKKTDTDEILARKQKIIQNCQKLFKDIQQRQQGINDISSFTKPTKVLTLTDMRARLLDQIQQQNAKIHQGSQGNLTQNNQQQNQAIKKFHQKDQQLDDALDGIIDGIAGVTQKVKGINKKQDQIVEKTNKNKDKINKVSKRIQTDNDKLKKIIKQFSSSRCCLVATLLLLFVGLIVVVIKMFVV